MTPTDHETEEWVLVPREPTKAMLAPHRGLNRVRDTADLASRIYRGMLSRAPTPPSLPAGAADPVAWRPIESAPRNGTKIWAFQPGREQYTAWWAESLRGEEFWQDEADDEPEPTHWMPQSPPPSGIDASVAVAEATCAGNPATDHVDLSPTTAGSAESVKLAPMSAWRRQRGCAELHHAFPGECPYCGAAATTHPQEGDALDLQADLDLLGGLVLNLEDGEPLVVRNPLALSRVLRRVLSTAYPANLDLALASPTPTQTGEG